jgi:hypothetical protein
MEQERTDDAEALPQVSIDRQKLDCFDSAGWDGAFPVNQDQADEDQLMRYLGNLLKPLSAVAACLGGNCVGALHRVRAAKPSRGSLIETAERLAGEATWVVAFQKTCKELGLETFPDTYNFSDLWVRRDNRSLMAICVGLHFETLWQHAEPVVVRVGEKCVFFGVGDGYHRDFEKHGVAWNNVAGRLKEIIALDEVRGVQDE